MLLRSKSLPLIGVLLGSYAFQCFSQDTGTINVSALITAPTCIIDVNGSKNAIITLPDTSTTVFYKTGAISSGTSFTINVTQCGDTPSDAMDIVVSKSNTDKGAVIPVNGSAENIAFHMTKNNIEQTFNNPPGSETYPISLTNGAGKIEDMAIEYYATAIPVKAGTLTANLTVAIDYK